MRRQRSSPGLTEIISFRANPHDLYYVKTIYMQDDMC